MIGRLLIVVLLLASALPASAQMLLMGMGPGSAGVGSSINLTSSGPSTGQPLTASTNFTVNLSAGTFNGSQTVIVSDASAGGTITPSVGSAGASSVTVTPTNGATSFTFTYNPVQSAVYSLSVTNAQGWNNPAALPYTVTAPSCSSLTTALAAMTGVSTPMADRYALALCGLQTAGTLAKLDALYVLGGDSAANSFVNLVNPGTFTASVISTCTFGAFVGHQCDGISGAITTGMTPSTATSPHYTLNAASLGLGVTTPRTWGIGSCNDIGGFTTNQPTLIGANSSGNQIARLNGAGLVSVAQPAGQSTLGRWVANRTSSTALELFKNNVSVGTNATATTAVPSGPIYIGSSATLVANQANFCPDEISWAFIGGSLAAGDLTALDTAMSYFPYKPNVPVYAARGGYYTKVFDSNLAADQLTTTDINGTNGAGFTWYTMPFAGETAPQPQSNWTAVAGTGVTLNAANDTGVSVGRLFSAGNNSFYGTGSISGSTLTLTTVQAGVGAATVLPGQIVAGAGIPQGTVTILAYGTNGTSGTGSTGTYALSSSVGTVASEQINGYAIVGKTFSGGGYFEACMSFDPTQSGASATFHPSFWLSTTLGYLSSNRQHPTWATATPMFHEIDLFEELATGVAGTTLHSFTNWEWTQNTNYTGAVGNDSFFHPTTANINSPTFTVQNCYEAWWQLAASNGGTGRTVRFVNRRMPGGGITQNSYSATGGGSPAATPSNPNGFFFGAEGDQFILIINGGATTFGATFSRVTVWQ